MEPISFIPQFIKKNIIWTDEGDCPNIGAGSLNIFFIIWRWCNSKRVWTGVKYACIHMYIYLWIQKEKTYQIETGINCYIALAYNAINCCHKTSSCQYTCIIFTEATDIRIRNVFDRRYTTIQYIYIYNVLSNTSSWAGDKTINHGQTNGVHYQLISNNQQELINAPFPDIVNFDMLDIGRVCCGLFRCGNVINS